MPPEALKIIETFPLRCPTAAGLIKQRQCLKMLCHPLSLPLWRFVWVTTQDFSSNRCFHWLWSILLSRKCDCLLLLSFIWKGHWENPGFYSTVIDQSRFLDRDTERVCFSNLEPRYELVCFYVCLLPHGQPGQPAAGRLSPSAPSAPSCWTPSPPPFLSPPSPAAPSTARWFAPGHQEGGREGRMRDGS